MTRFLPTNLRARPIPDVTRFACIAGADQASRYVVDAIVKALSPLHDPIKRGGDIVRQCYLDVRMNIYKVEWAWSGRSQDTEIVALRKERIERAQSIRGRMIPA